MHLDLAHALVTVALIFATLRVLEHFGVIEKGAKRHFNWRVFVSIAVVIFIFNLIWPA